MVGLAVLTVYVALSVHYATVWQSELTLWTWATARAPLKPRPRINLALALMERRRFQEAAQQLDLAEALSEQIAMPTYDKDSTIKSVRDNRAVLARLIEPPR